MLECLQDVIFTDYANRWLWDIDTYEFLTVGEIRKWIDDAVPSTLSLETRWNIFVPRKINILIWHVILDRIPTQINLAHKNLDIPSALCMICKLEVEQLDHCFVRCEVTARTYNTIFSWIDIVLSDFDSIHEIFTFFDNDMTNAKKRRVVDAIAYTTIWYIWRFRNDMVRTRLGKSPVSSIS